MPTSDILTFRINREAMKEEMTKRLPAAMAILSNPEVQGITQLQKETAVLAVMHERIAFLKTQGFIFDGDSPRQPFDAYIDPATEDYVFRQGYGSERLQKAMHGQL